MQESIVSMGRSKFKCLAETQRLARLRLLLRKLARTIIYQGGEIEEMKKEDSVLQEDKKDSKLEGEGTRMMRKITILKKEVMQDKIGQQIEET
jgi:hypothetical protein